MDSVFVFLVMVGNGQECTTASGDLGICKYTYECPYFSTNIMPIRGPAMNCGYNRICCTTCITSDRELGVYKSLNSSPFSPHSFREAKYMNLTDHGETNTNVKMKTFGIEAYDRYCTSDSKIQSIYECISISDFPTTNPKCCGTIHNADSNEAGILANPWTVFLDYPLHYYYINYIKRGKGTLISNTHVLTAAHCVYEERPKNIKFGSTYRTCTKLPREGTGSTDDPFCISIDLISIHEEYKGSSDHHNDIALIKLRHPVKYTEFIYPICMPSNDALENNLVAVTGFHENRRLLRLRPVTQQECKDSLNLLTKNTFGKYIWEKQICAGGNGDDTCKGDSGSALMGNKGDRFELLGLVSYGSKTCDMDRVPGVYTRVFSYIDWIHHNIDMMQRFHFKNTRFGSVN